MVSELACQVGQNFVSPLELHAEESRREHLHYGAGHFNMFVSRHAAFYPELWGDATPDLCYICTMIDLHQGLTGEELRGAEAPDLGTLVLSELDAVTSLLKGNFREALGKHFGEYLSVSGRS